MILPILLSFYFSFFDWNGINRTMNFVGLRNFVRAIQDESFLNALRITFFFTIPGALAGNLLGMLFAVLVNRPEPLAKVYRAVFFFPLLISAVAIGFISFPGSPRARSRRNRPPEKGVMGPGWTARCCRQPRR